MSPVLLSTPAVVTSSRPMGESDLLVCLFTLESGKLRAVAKGAKRSKKRFMNALEPFTEIDAGLAMGRSSGLWRLDSAVITKSHVPIRQDYSCFVFGSLCLELVELWQKDGANEPGVFCLLKWYLSGLSEGRDPMEMSLIFKARLLRHAGFMPGLKACRLCGKMPKNGPVYYDRRTGEILCYNCRKPASGSAGITLGTARCLDFMVNCGLEQVNRLKLGKQQMTEAWEYMKVLHCSNLQRQPASYKLINQNINNRGS